jgi:hypothetical protein
MADLKPCTATHHNAYQTEKDGECRPAFAICRKAQSRRASSVPCSPKSLLAKAIGPPARARPTLMASIAACGACGIPYQRTPHDNQQAESWLRRSIELDPTLARAHAILARVLAARCWLGSSDDIDRDLTCCRGARRSATLRLTTQCRSLTSCFTNTNGRSVRLDERLISIRLCAWVFCARRNPPFHGSIHRGPRSTDALPAA